MRIGLEQVEFCASLLSAARKCNIAIGRASNHGERRFVWRDQMTERIIKCPPAPNDKDALENACEALVLYFSNP